MGGAIKAEGEEGQEARRGGEMGGGTGEPEGGEGGRKRCGGEGGGGGTKSWF